jgi:hypothetical protein
MAGQANLRTGTFDMASLLSQRFVSAAKFGLNTIADVLAADRQTHNTIVRDMVSAFIDVTTDVLRISGSTITGRMIKADEYSRAPTQRDLPGQTVGFPMDRYQFALGWTSEWLKRKSPGRPRHRTATVSDCRAADSARRDSDRNLQPDEHQLC